MIDVKRKEDCVGCGACIDSCTKNAISPFIDDEGFFYPKVDGLLCVDCGLCEKVCPVINASSLEKTNKYKPQAFACYHNDEEVRFQSTTGGVFSALAEKMLEDNGYISGAVWTPDFGAEHIVSNNKTDLERIRGSKYFQSNSIGIYKKIRKLLLAKENVLACGTPCQMAALRSYLGNKEYDNLIIIDFICCCINSPKVFRAYLDDLEKRYNSKVVSYHPKNKEYGGWHNFAFKAVFQNGEIYHENRRNDPFTDCFIGLHVAARPCCYECRFKSLPRISDITIADFWGIEDVDPEWDSEKGTSLVLVNNEKGKDFFEGLGELVSMKEENFELSIKQNSHICESVSYPKVDRSKFYNNLDLKGFMYAYKRMYSKLNYVSAIINKLKNIIR